MTMSEDYINLKMGDRISFLDEDTGEIFKARIFEIDLFRNCFSKEPDRIKILANKDVKSFCLVRDY